MFIVTSAGTPVLNEALVCAVFLQIEIFTIGFDSR